jgi:hypothetical protein
VTARWGSGKPVIALGPTSTAFRRRRIASVAYYDPIMTGRPATRGAQPGMPLRRRGAAVEGDEQQHSRARRIWPGIAEELVGTKALRARRDVQDVTSRSRARLDNLGQLGDGNQNGLSRRVKFQGESAYAAAPWRAAVPLDVELMDVGWRPRAFRIQQRCIT